MLLVGILQLYIQLYIIITPKLRKKWYIDNEIFLNIVETSTAPSTTTTYRPTTEPGNTS